MSRIFTIRINTRIDKEFETGREVDEVESFTNLENLLTKTGGANEDVIQHIRKANTALVQLYPIYAQYFESPGNS